MTSWVLFWSFVIVVVKIALVLGISLGTVSYLIFAERKIAAWAQDRLGPNRVGPWGLVQPLIDGAKLLIKEAMTPDYVVKPIYNLAPALAFIAAAIGFAVVPFGPVGANAPLLFGNKDLPVDFQIAPSIDIGILYILAIGSLGVYGVILGGWASNNKYSFLGGLRSSAQLISYEIPLGMSILGMILLCGSVDLSRIIEWQDRHVWGFVAQPLGFLLFLISGFAETNRLPFDLPESEQELVGGFHTEYSGMKFGLFFLGEYLHVITVSFLIVILFLGGWNVPFLINGQQLGWIAAGAKLAVMLAKVVGVIGFIMLVRWTLPRFRYDTLMDLAWKRMIPLALGNLLVTALLLYLLRGVLGYQFY